MIIVISIIAYLAIVYAICQLASINELWRDEE